MTRDETHVLKSLVLDAGKTVAEISGEINVPTDRVASALVNLAARGSAIPVAGSAPACWRKLPKAKPVKRGSKGQLSHLEETMALHIR